jgi:hypothetical protein
MIRLGFILVFRYIISLINEYELVFKLPKLLGCLIRF